MTKEEAIKYLQQLYPNGGHCWLDEQRIEAVGMAIQALQEEPVSEDLENYINELSKQFPEVSFAKLSRIVVRVSRWQRNQDVKNKLPKVISRTDLDEYAYQCAYDMSNDWAIDNPTWHDVEDACKLGAKWQEKQDQSTIELAEDHAMLAGMEKMKEEMMAKAVETTFNVLLSSGLYDKLLIKGCKEGDKLLVIKKDEI
jgi:hypothetical protein